MKTRSKKLKAFTHVRVAMLLFMLLSTFGPLVQPAAAQQLELDAEICLALQTALIVNSEGVFIGADVDAAIDVLTGLDLGRPLEVTVLAGLVLLNGCDPFLPVPSDGPDPGFMTVTVLDAGDNVIPGATVTFTAISEGGTVNPDGSFTTSTT